MEGDCCCVEDVLKVGCEVSLVVDKVNTMGAHLAILVCHIEGVNVGVDAIMKKKKKDKKSKDGFISELTIEGRQGWTSYSTWASKLVRYDRTSIVRGRVVEVEGKKSQRGHLQVHMDDWRVVGEMDLTHSDEEIWGEKKDESDDGDDDGGDKHVKGKKERHAMFAQWILQHYDLQYLQNPKAGGILDVGGGKGDLSKIFCGMGISCCVVDPREVCASVVSEEPFERIQSCFHFESTFAHARPFCLVVAMHADQGTEHAIRYALRIGCPFAVVPCCVFPSEFPERRFRGGGVRTHRTFVKYLRDIPKEKALVDRLDQLEGRNVILYTQKIE